MKPEIRKYRSWAEVPKNELEYWLTKTPQERLSAATQLIKFAYQLYNANPQNQLIDAGQFHPVYQVTQRRKS